MKNLKNLLFLAALWFSQGANAGVIIKEVSILGTDPGSVAYLYLSVYSGGSFNISAIGADTLGSSYNDDPAIALFAAPLSEDNFIISDDDSGGGYNSLINNLVLTPGEYVLAISQSGLLVNEAVTGLNADSVYDPGLIQVTFSSNDASFAVPEPSSIALTLSGIILLRNRKNSQALSTNPLR